jgi:hypothetical protein
VQCEYRLRNHYARRRQTATVARGWTNSSASGHGTPPPWTRDRTRPRVGGLLPTVLTESRAPTARRDLQEACSRNCRRVSAGSHPCFSHRTPAHCWSDWRPGLPTLTSGMVCGQRADCLLSGRRRTRRWSVHPDPRRVVRMGRVCRIGIARSVYRRFAPTALTTLPQRTLHRRVSSAAPSR